MSENLGKSLIDAGIHFGHRASRWNPKMQPYIFGKRSMIHIVDVRETLKGLLRAKKFIAQIVAGGKDVLFVGTKRQARKPVQEVALETGMHYVNDRWLGGTLTNFRTIRSRLARLEELEKMFEDGVADEMSKKEGSRHRRELRKILRNLDGIRRMEKLPGVLVIVDQKREIIAVREARKLGIPTVCLLDTDSDPDMVDLPIPGNDDSMRGIDIIIHEIGRAIAEGVAARATRGEGEGEGPAFRRRSQRPSTSREMEQAVEASQGEGEAETPAPAEPAASESPAPAVAENAGDAEPQQ